MGCPVAKIAKHSAGCSLMRQPEHAASVIEAMTRAVKIPVTVKMRAGWNDGSRNAPTLARMVQDAGAAAVTIHGRTAEQSYSGLADWDLVARVASELTIPVLGQRRLRRAGAGDRTHGGRRQRRARRPRRAAQSLDPGAGGGHRPRAVRRGSSRCVSGDSSCATTSSCCSTNGSTRAKGSGTLRRAVAPTGPWRSPEGAIAGSSTRSARSAPGIPRGSKAGRISGRASIAPRALQSFTRSSTSSSSPFPRCLV